MDEPDKRLPWTWILGLTALAYLPVLGGVFTFDDAKTVLRNTYLGHWDVLLRSFWSPSGRPLFWLSMHLDHAVWGRNPAGYHLTSLGLHLAATALLAAFARNLLGRAAGTAAGLLFGLHPLASAAACYVSQRSEILAAVFCLLALHALFRGKPAWAWGSWILALLSKESAASLPACALALLPLFPPGRRKAVRAWGLAGSALALLGALWLLPRLKLPDGRLPWAQYVPAGVSATGHYLRLWLLPFGQAADADTGGSPWIAGACLLAAWRLSPAAVGAALLALAPTVLVPLLDPVQEYRAYLACAFLALAAAPLLGSFRRLGILAALGLSLTLARSDLWRSEDGLWRRDLRVFPGKLRIHANLARASWYQRRFAAAEWAMLRAVRIREVPAQHRDLARLALDRGDAVRALSEMERAREMDPSPGPPGDPLDAWFEQARRGAARGP